MLELLVRGVLLIEAANGGFSWGVEREVVSLTWRDRAVKEEHDWGD